MPTRPAEQPCVGVARSSMTQPTMDLPTMVTAFDADRSNSGNSNRDRNRTGSRSPDDNSGTERHSPDAAAALFSFRTQRHCSAAPGAPRSLPGRTYADGQQAVCLALGLLAVLLRQSA